MLVLVVLAVIGLGFATTAALRTFLVGRIDNQLVSAQRPYVARAMRGPMGSFSSEGRARSHTLAPTRFYVGVTDPNGDLVSQTDVGLPARNPTPTLSRQQLTPGAPDSTKAPLTVGSRGDPSFEYRVLLTSLPDGSGTLVLAAPLQDVGATVHRLIVIEILATVAVLVLITLVSLRLVKIGLKPLEDMATTADAIAAGDLSKRIAVSGERTEVGRLGRALNKMLAQIERAFRERKVSEERLRESELRLRTFVADASHELRTPLTSIRGFAELYRQGAVHTPEETAKVMTRIEENSERMAMLVEDLLLLARLDHGPALKREPIDLAEVVTDAVTDAHAVEPDRSISLVAQSGVIVEGDDGRLRQVVANLLSNARNHTTAETPLEVRVAREGVSALVEVADLGPGMNEEIARHVFERFYRADSSRSRVAGGTGLGLSIVAAITQGHGGRVGVTTAPGTGACFQVELPLLPEPATAERWELPKALA